VNSTRQLIARMPDGRVLSRSDLPTPSSRLHWTPARKQVVIECLRQGLATMEELQARYSISTDELLAWNRLYADRDRKALMTTQIPLHREITKVEKHDTD
jgi:hypothetical protein